MVKTKKSKSAAQRTKTKVTVCDQRSDVNAKKKSVKGKAGLLAPGSLAKEIAKLREENKLLRENIELQKKSKGKSKGSEEQDSELGMIPKPPGEVGRVTTLDGKKVGYNLQEEMGMDDHSDLFNEVKVGIHFLKISRTYIRAV